MKHTVSERVRVPKKVQKDTQSIIETHRVSEGHREDQRGTDSVRETQRSSKRHREGKKIQ